MKRMHFDFDFDDNELFDEQVEKVIQAKVREVVRRENNSIIAEETNKEFNRLIKEGENYYYSKMTSIIRKRIENIVCEIVEKPEYQNKINNTIEKKIKEMIDIKIKTLESSIYKDVRKAVDEVVNEVVSEKLSKILDAMGYKDEK